jgi:tripartite-type tricarboxylate transporter receptor subunit TctC
MIARAAFCATVLGVLLHAAAPAMAQAPYPSRPLTIVVPFPPGGAADTQARLVAEKLRALFGQPVIVENRAGGGGNIGAEAVARAAPDGTTLLCAPPGTLSVAHLLYPKLSFDPRTFEPVSVISTYPTFILGRADLPAATIPELIAYARANPGKISYASQGNGQISHLTFEMLKMMTGVDMVHVPYRGSAPAMTDLLSGQIDVFADTPLAGAPHVKAGKLKLLAVGSPRRVAGFPDVQAVAETIPGFESETWMAIAATPGTPKEITAKLSAAIAQAVQSPDVKARIVELQAEPFGSTPDETARVIRASTERWEPVIVAAKIRIE